MGVQCVENLRSLLTRSVIVLVISAKASGESPSIPVASECSGPEGILCSLIVGDLRCRVFSHSLCRKEGSLSRGSEE